MTEMNESYPPGHKWVIALLVLVAAVTVAYWADFFSSGAVRVREDDAYLVFEQAFPLADGWLAACALLGAGGLWRRRPAGLLFGLLTGSSLVYLGCLDVLFNLNTGNYAIASGAMRAEVVINAGSLAIGALLIVYLWRHRERLLQPD
jgi:hypothetical protein